ncbi:metallophosphoesterase [Pseudoalteromonas fenneropenaei]|uniref:Metallophosphoesterase n=1 Tax=Pseudoalteromonas fenneropenaei TaxID=1737459 RepID=A0ABV7CHC7_9GAMM
MTWFEDGFSLHKDHALIAHITDSHLFADEQGEYFSVNTAAHFRRVLTKLSELNLDAIIFGGDLTQDHTAESYHTFARLFAESKLTCPMFWVPGNHDDIALLRDISHGQICMSKVLRTNKLQFLLANSKGSTPAGWCEAQHLSELANAISDFAGKSVVVCHHHPLPIQGYLDKHILENGPFLLNVCANSEKVTAIVHGHVHNDYFLWYRNLQIYATPATSIQFERHTKDWQQRNLGPGFRLIECRGDAISTWVAWA